MKLTATSAATAILLALTSVASAAHIRHNTNAPSHRDYQALGPNGERSQPRFFEVRPSFGGSRGSNQTFTGGPSGGLGS